MFREVLRWIPNRIVTVLNMKGGIATEVYIIEVYRKVHESIKYKTIHPNNISSTRLISKY